MDRLHLNFVGMIGITILFLIGCQQSEINQVKNCYMKQAGRWVVCDQQHHYTFWYPSWIEEGSQVTKDVEVYTYDSPQTCSPSITGASKTEELSSINGKVEWGRVDVWEKFRGGDIPDWEHVFCKKEGTPPPREVYAFCTQNNGNTVVICIDQMKDNPALARQVFESFRWTD